MDCKGILDTLIKKMREADMSKVKAVVGFDGLVDEVVQVVEKRIDPDNFERVNYIEDFGKKILASAGLSMNIEMVPLQQKIGGNGPIFANSLMKQGFGLTFIGALGLPDIHPVFKEMTEKCTYYSISNPGSSDAIEFLDGKVISSKLEALKEVSWEALMKYVGLDTFLQILNESELVGFENWTLVVKTSDIWKHIIREVLPNMQQREEKRTLFIDLADPEKRDNNDIVEALSLIAEFSKYFKVILGLNKKEACEIAELFGKTIPSYEKQDVAELTNYVKSKLTLDTLVVHPVREACACGDNGETILIQGPYCVKPKLTTGAGDNFNAGFVLGSMLKYSLEEALLLGTANSGFYVRNARSASLKELTHFLEDWKEERLDKE